MKASTARRIFSRAMEKAREVFEKNGLPHNSNPLFKEINDSIWEAVKQLKDGAMKIEDVKNLSRPQLLVLYFYLDRRTKIGKAIQERFYSLVNSGGIPFFK